MIQNGSAAQLELASATGVADVRILEWYYTFRRSQIQADAYYFGILLDSLYNDLSRAGNNSDRFADYSRDIVVEI